MSNPTHSPALIKEYTDSCAQLGELEYRLADLNLKKRALITKIAEIQKVAALSAATSVIPPSEAANGVAE